MNEQSDEKIREYQEMFSSEDAKAFYQQLTSSAFYEAYNQ